MTKIEIELRDQLEENISVHKNLLKMSKDITDVIQNIHKKLKKGGKILFCGNGGSAADAQHLAAEFLVRLNPKINRNPFPVVNLVSDTSTITACSNDFSFDLLFSRNLEALGKKNDLLIVISTSGNSKNIINVLKAAKRKKIYSIAFLGNEGGKAKKHVDLPLIVKSKNTARIQECHIFLGHHIFNKVESLLIKR